MPDPAVVPSITPRVNHMIVNVHGRIENIRRYDGRVFTRIISPAADSYSAPAMVEIESKTTLGQLGDDWTGTCRVGGYRNDYDTRDDNGDKRPVKSARNTIVVIE